MTAEVRHLLKMKRQGAFHKIVQEEPAMGWVDVRGGWLQGARPNCRRCGAKATLNLMYSPGPWTCYDCRNKDTADPYTWDTKTGINLGYKRDV